MGTRYLKALADVENGSAWILGGSVPAATFWRALDGDSGANPPTSDGDVDFAAASNVTLPGGAPSRLRVRVLNAASGTAPPIKKKAHAVKWTWRRAGGGTLSAYPRCRVWCDGVEIAAEAAAGGDPGTVFVDRTFTLSEAQAALIDWTKAIDVSFDTPTAGAGTAGIRITRAWLEYPDAYSLEATGTGSLQGEAFGVLSNGYATGTGSLQGWARGQIVSMSSTGTGSLSGEAEGGLSNGYATGTGSLSGSANGSPSAAGSSESIGSLSGTAVGSLVYSPSSGKAQGDGPGGGPAAARGG